MERFKLSYDGNPLIKSHEWPIVQDKEIANKLRRLFKKTDSNFIMLGPIKYEGKTFYSWQSTKALSFDVILTECALDTRRWRNYPKESL